MYQIYALYYGYLFSNQTLLQLKKYESEANVKPMTPSKIPVGNFRKAHLIDFPEA